MLSSWLIALHTKKDDCLFVTRVVVVLSHLFFGFVIFPRGARFLGGFARKDDVTSALFGERSSVARFSCCTFLDYSAKING